MTGKHIELFLVDGEPGGITTADISGWTGHVLSGPRTQLKSLLERDEAQSNGVYLLLGEDPASVDNVSCYIGKTESFRQRFHDHDRKRDWWQRAVLISSREDAFNEGHWGYIEARLVEIATRAARCTLRDNIQTPKPRKFSEAQISDAEDFLAQVRTVLPVLGVNVFKTRRSPEVEREDAHEETTSPVFSLVMPKRNVDARARVIGDEFVLLTDSQVVGAWDAVGSSPSTRRAYAALRARFEKLVADGSIEVRGDHGVVTRDIPFTSPSGAGAIAIGRSCNGRTWWRTGDLTYGDWEDGGASAATENGVTA